MAAYRRHAQGMWHNQVVDRQSSGWSGHAATFDAMLDLFPDPRGAHRRHVDPS